MRYDALPLRAAGDLSGPDAHERWLADEVVVDFPSVRPLVDRMRLAFFGGVEPDAPSLSAELRLTPQQARLGGRVPVDLPVPSVCAACGGRGEVWNEPCARCEGAGAGITRRVVEVRVPSGVRDGACFAFSVFAPHAVTTRVRLRVSVC